MIKNFKFWWATPFVGVAGALLALSVNWPLPWIIGPMLIMIVVRCTGWMIIEVPHGRPVGQWLIATSIGLHLTQSMVADIAAHLPLMLFAGLLTLLLALLGIALMRRLGMDLTTAYLAFMPANFAEMVQIGMRYEANVSHIAAAHSIRIVVIVLTVPAVMFFLSGASPNASRHQLATDWQWVAPILLAGLASAIAWRRVGWPNPWMFGPLALTALATASFDLHTALPIDFGHFAQLMIGCSLGSFIDRQFFSRAPTYLLKVFAFTLCMIAGTFGFAWTLGSLTDFARPTLALGMMPGSSTEMYLTAEALHLAAGMVTAIQIMRLVVVMACAEPVLKMWLRYEASKGE
ncbi:AbrB family transcriptional regulator [Pseudomonas sp. NPDC089547]|uniref:AbrB family transcriptional regulator n=1 Tax=Pseudomonas sp. NPDC089547 TaxID=3390652 RepID=UPI003D060E56